MDQVNGDNWDVAESGGVPFGPGGAVAVCGTAESQKGKEGTTQDHPLLPLFEGTLHSTQVWWSRCCLVIPDNINRDLPLISESALNPSYVLLGQWRIWHLWQGTRKRADPCWAISDSSVSGHLLASTCGRQAQSGENMFTPLKRMKAYSAILINHFKTTTAGNKVLSTNKNPK